MFSTFNGNNRVLLTVVPWSKCHDAPRASRTLLDHRMQQKLPKQFFLYVLKIVFQAYLV